MRFETTKALQLLLLALFSAQLACVCWESKFSEKELLEIGRSRLSKFCSSEGIPIERFADKPTIGEAEDVQWIDYTSDRDSEGSYYFFRVMVDNCGRVEKSWQKYPIDP